LISKSLYYFWSLYSQVLALVKIYIFLLLLSSILPIAAIILITMIFTSIKRIIFQVLTLIKDGVLAL
jgi:hypothetical protein